MEIIFFLSIVIAVVAVLTSIVLIRRVKKQIAEMTDALVDVKNGNGNRRILSATNELTAPLAYEINEIVDDPHIAVHIQSYPDRLFGNINVIINLFILKNRYPVNQDISCQLCGLNALDFQSKLIGI